MAQSGTITAVRNNFRDVEITITGVLQSSNTPPFLSYGYPVGSYTIQGTLDTASAPTLNLQGSNDDGVTWVTIGTAISVSTFPTSGSLIGTNNQVFDMYQFLVTGGDAGTNLNFYVYLAATFG